MNSRRRIDSIPHLALLLFAFLCFAGPNAARAQVSPGPLSTPHEKLDGPTECFQCHAGSTAKNGMDARCLTCHTEIGWMQTAVRGTHSKLEG